MEAPAGIYHEGPPEDDCDMIYQNWRAGEILDILSQKGYCMLQTDLDPNILQAALEEAENLTRWSEGWKEETVSEYLGFDNSTKVSYIAEEYLFSDVPATTDMQDASEVEALIYLESFVADIINGISEHDRLTPLGATMVRLPYVDKRDQIDSKPLPIESKDLEEGHIADFLQFVRRRKMCLFFMAECEGGEIELYTKDGDDISLPCNSNRLLIFRPDIMSYCFRPEGSSVILQSFLLSDEIQWNKELQMAHEGSLKEYYEFLGINNVLIPGGDQTFVKALALRAAASVNQPKKYWAMFTGGTDCAVEFPPTRFDVDTYWDSSPGFEARGWKSTTRHGAFLHEDEFSGFDNKFFGYSEEEAKIWAPGQRWQLEVGYELLHKSGHRRGVSTNLEIGIVAGDVGPDWHNLNLPWNDIVGNEEDVCQGQFGVMTVIGYARLAAYMGLTGQLWTCSTACSSSLVAMAHGHHEMLDRRGANIVFGINQLLSPVCYINFSAAGMLSTVGRCHTYNDTADGFMRGEGIGSAFIQMENERKTQGDRLACIAGTFSNQDGRSASMTAPHGPSQVKLIKTSLKMSNLVADEINIAECHGTGTALGDPIEVGAIQTALGAMKRKVPFFLTSAKSIHGHMESGAGICGFTKCILMMTGSICPPNCHLKCINPNLLFQGFPCFITDVLSDVGKNSCCCGVSSFGATGSNARADVIGYCSMGYNAVDPCPAEKCTVLTTPCPRCLGDMCYLCGENVAKLNSKDQHRCCMIRNAGAEYEVCSLCFEGSSHHLEKVADAEAEAASLEGLCISGTWTAWSKMETMEVGEEDSYVYDLVLGETGWEQFRLHLNGKMDKAIFPVRANGDASMHILGPGKIMDGSCWIIDGRHAGLKTGAVIRISFTSKGTQKHISWQPTGEVSLDKLQQIGYQHRYHLVRGIHGVNNGLNDTDMDECKDQEMTLVTSENGIYEYEVQFRIGNMGRETFRFIRDKDPSQVIYPAYNIDRKDRRAPASVPVSGPDDGAGLKFFAVRGEKFELSTVRLSITSDSITVAADSSRPEVWKSAKHVVSRYSVRGTFTSWAWSEMIPDEAGEVHRFQTPVNFLGKADFQISIAGDETKFLYPSTEKTGFCVTKGPSHEGADEYWQMHVPFGTPMEIVLDWSQKDRRQVVTWRKFETLSSESADSDLASLKVLKDLQATTLPVALVFPGQGSQYVKMLGEVKDLTVVREMLEKSKDILGYDILKLCLEGPEEKLEETRYTQPAVFIGGLAAIEKLKAERPEAVENPRFVAGLSLGEYTALCVAGVFNFEDGLRLVKLRGEAMQEAAMKGKQKMLSVAGLNERKLKQLCREAKEADFTGNGVCSIANALFPNGYSVGGTERSIKALKGLAEGAGAMQAKILKTGGAFHTSMMQPAQDKLSHALEMTLPKMKAPRCTIYMNATAEAIPAGSDPAKIVSNLKKQLTNTVLWEPSVRKMIAAGTTDFYECGPMKQLKAMMKRIDTDTWNGMVNIEV